MFFLKKVITYLLLLPPGNVAVFLLLLGLYLLRRTSKGAGYLLLLAGGFLYLLSTEPVAKALVKPLESPYRHPDKGKLLSCDAIVVLGGGIKPGAPFLELKNDLDEDPFKRATAAYKLYQLKSRPIIASGYSVKDRLPEAAVMKTYLSYLGVPPKDIHTDDKSRDTYENALFVRKIVERLDLKKVCLITSAYHMERSLFLFRKAGFKEENLVPVAVDFKTSDSTFTVYKLLPTAYWLEVSSKALKEYLGLLFYKLKG